VAFSNEYHLGLEAAITAMRLITGLLAMVLAWVAHAVSSTRVKSVVTTLSIWIPFLAGILT
jgi:hypothetical protein